ncbi:MAG: hypothetical protein BA862_06305 [Desulfobulbaceae bacterium S3730MH12]|nr:MAG: hypothetical protein BA862_06305 [Desulfobulbaceae bacterium S3730MH12]
MILINQTKYRGSVLTYEFSITKKSGNTPYLWAKPKQKTTKKFYLRNFFAKKNHRTTTTYHKRLPGDENI